MFGFANGLLAFLALAAVLIFLPVLRHRRAPAVWWGEERLLFTTRYASVRQKYGAWAFLLGVMVYEFIVVFNSMARENWLLAADAGSPPCWTGSCILLRL